jgi:hypothetical protein
MPKIFGTSLVGILAASVAFFMLGWLWYGVIFDEMWMTLAGITEAEPDPMTMVWGFVITAIQVLGISFVLNHAGASTLATCAHTAIVLAVYIAVPVLSYGLIYGQQYPMKMLQLDAGHLLIGYCIVGAVLSFFRGKDAVEN